MSKQKNGQNGQRVATEQKPVQNGLADALGFGGFPNNQGLPWTEQVSNATTLFKNLRWYFVSNDRQLLNELYVEIGLVQTICNVPVDDALRGGVTIKSSQLNEEEIKKLLISLDRDNDISNVGQAAKWMRLFGGGAILILTDQDPTEPLDVDSLSEDDAIEFRAVDMWELFWDMQNTEGYDPTLAMDVVEYYNYYGEQVHKSRVMILKGLEAPSFLRPRLRGWGFSVVEALVRSINQYLKSTDLLFEVLDEFKLDIFKIKGLTSALMSSQGEQMVKTRTNITNFQKNYQNAITMDSEDDYDHKQLSFTGLGEALKEIRMQVAADMRMPLTKLFGISAAGFNSGEDDIEVYNAMVESEIRNKIKYLIMRVIELKCQVLFGVIPDDLEIEFQPLRVMSSEQEENVKTQKFTRLSTAQSQGLITSEEFREASNKGDLFDINLDPAVDLMTGYHDDVIGESGNPYQDKDQSNPGADRADTESPYADTIGGVAPGDDNNVSDKKSPKGDAPPPSSSDSPNLKIKKENNIFNDAWNEDDHPRDGAGKFSKSGSSSGKGKGKSKGGKSDLPTLSKKLQSIKKSDKDLSSAAYEWSRSAYHYVQMIEKGDGDKLSPESREIGDRVTDNLKKGWDSLPSYEGKLVRDINVELSDVPNIFKVGESFETDSFTSFTAADSYTTRRKVRIQVDSSTKGKYIADLCQDKNEEEVLIPKGTKYKIDRIEESEEAPYYIIHVKEI